MHITEFPCELHIFKASKMFIYMSKKIAIPKQSNVSCISWNHSSGYIALGGEDGMLKVLKLESGGGGNLSMNLGLEGHTGQVCVAVWNEVFQKLTTSDEHGVIIVWMLYKGSWYEEMINNRNKSTVTSMAWGSDGQKICIAYEDGAVIVGSVDGSRVWGKDIKGPGLAAVQWSPDNSMLLFALTNGELHLYDDQGNFTMPVSVQAGAGASEVVSLEWFPGPAPPARPVLAVCYKSGVIVLMKNCIEEDSVAVETGLAAVAGRWSHDGAVLALAGCTPDRNNVVQFFSAYGEHIRTLRVPGGSMKALSWEQRSLRLAIAIDSFIYFANVKRDHKYAFYGNTLAFVSDTDTVTFWDTRTHQSWVSRVPEVAALSGAEEYCAAAGAGALSVFNQQGVQCDAKSVSIPVQFVTINSKAVVVAASKDCFLVWRFATPTRPRCTEQLFQADGSCAGAGGGAGALHEDPVCSVASSDTHLVVGRRSGALLLFSLVHLKKITSINIHSRPYSMGLNSNSSKLFVIEQGGALHLLDTEAGGAGVGRAAARRDAWAACWAADNPRLLAVAEKARLYVLRDGEPEEPLALHGYLCGFQELEITTALLDSISGACSAAHAARAEVKSLRDTRQLIETVGLKEAEDFIKDNPHPRLWLLLAEAGLRRWRAEGALAAAEGAFVRRGEYAGVRLAARLAALRAPALREAEVLAYFREFDAAEQLYHDEDRRDLAIALRRRLGHWRRVVELMKMSASGSEAQLRQAYCHLGDYYIDRQNWAGALEYYSMSQHAEGLRKCFLALEDNDALSALGGLGGAPSQRLARERAPSPGAASDAGAALQTASIQGVVQLKESGRLAQAAAMAAQLADAEAARAGSPARVVRLYALAGHLYSQHSPEPRGGARGARCWRRAGAAAWLARAGGAARALSRPAPPAPRAEPALRAAARLYDHVELLHPAQHLQAWCAVASVAIQARAFELCSKAFIKLEAINPEVFVGLAVEVFTRHRPQDVRGNRVECPHCELSLPEWSSWCRGCEAQLETCAASGRALAPRAARACAACGARASRHELVLRRACPLCHAPL